MAPTAAMAPINTRGIRQVLDVIPQPILRSLGTLSGSQTSVLQARSADGLTNTQVGIIVGTIVGVFIFVAIVFYCCFQQRQRNRAMMTKNYRNSYSSYASHDTAYVVEVQPPPRTPPPPQTWNRRRSSRPRSERYSFTATAAYSRPPPDPFSAPPTYPPPAVERIPGGPKNPTYRALPIPNPRKPKVPRVP